MPLTIADLEFPSPIPALQWFKRLLRSLPVGDPIPEPHHSRVMSLLRRHHDAAAKIGLGVAFFSVTLDALGDRQFQIHRIDGSTETFSIRVALRRSAPQPLNLFYTAARHAIAPHLLAAKRDFFKDQPVQRCPITGQLFGSRTCRTCHQGATLSDLADQFLKEERLSPNLNWFIKTPKTELVEGEIKQRWIDYYCRNAAVTFVHQSVQERKEIA